MLRIHFTAEDLARTRVATGASLCEEVVFSLWRLNRRSVDPGLRSWRRTVSSRWNPSDPELFDLFTPNMLPNFLHPSVDPDPQATARAVVVSDQLRRRDCLAVLSEHRPDTEFTRRLADADPVAVARLGTSLGRYQAAAVNPHWTRISTLVDADRTHRGRMLADGGVEQLLSTLHPLVRWRFPVLEVQRLTADEEDRYLDGRGVVVQPSVFASRLLLAPEPDPAKQPLLVYPASRDQPLLDAAPTRRGPRAVAATLLGRTRGAVLEAIAESAGCTTSELSGTLGTSLASASQHATVLRHAGLIHTHRNGNAVLHTITPLGEALISGRADYC